jgi:hypothetical protein
MLFALTGCEGPVGPAGAPGESGTPGDDGNDGLPGGHFPGGTNVIPKDLEVGFAYSDVIILQSQVETVYGVVPAGKTLQVVGEVSVFSEKELIIEGTLEIVEGGILSAFGEVISPMAFPVLPAVSSTVSTGFLKAGSTGVIKGKGVLILPYALDEAFTKGLSYNSPEVGNVTRFPGSLSIREKDELEANWSSDEIEAIFDSDPSLETLRVKDVKNLLVTAIPKGKTLSLYGWYNTIYSDFNLTATNARLVVEAGAILKVTGVLPNFARITVTGGSYITNYGRIELEDVSSSIDTTGGTIVNDGVIQTVNINGTSITPTGLLNALLELPGNGAVHIGDGNISGPITLNNTTSLNQNIVIRKGITLQSSNLVTVTSPFDGVTLGKTITIEKDGIFALTGNITEIGASVINKGLISTANNTPEVLTSIFGDLPSGGNVDASVTIQAPSAPGPNEPIPDFTIPEGVTLTLNGAGSFGNTEVSLLVNGGLVLSGSGTLATRGDIIVGDKGSVNLDGAGRNITVAQAKSLAIPNGKTVKGLGSIIANAADAKIVIAGENYRTATTAGVPADSIRTTLEVFEGDREKLTDSITLDSPFGGGKAIGAVLFSSTGTLDLSATFDGAPTGDKVTLKSVIINDGTTNVGYIDQGTSDNVTPTYTTIRVTTGTNGNVQVTEPTIAAPYTEQFYRIVYNQVRIQYANLISPVLPRFNIGVKTSR